MHWGFACKECRQGLARLDNHKQICCRALGHAIRETLPKQSIYEHVSWSIRESERSVHGGSATCRCRTLVILMGATWQLSCKGCYSQDKRWLSVGPGVCLVGLQQNGPPAQIRNTNAHKAAHITVEFGGRAAALEDSGKTAQSNQGAASFSDMRPSAFSGTIFTKHSPSKRRPIRTGQCKYHG